MREIGFDSLFTFAFSRRKGTRAYDMKGQLSTAEKKERLARLMQAQQEVSLRRNRLLLGKELRLLVEAPGREQDSLLQCRTEGGKLCYIRAALADWAVCHGARHAGKNLCPLWGACRELTGPPHGRCLGAAFITRGNCCIPNIIFMNRKVETHEHTERTSGSPGRGHCGGSPPRRLDAAKRPRRPSAAEASLPTSTPCATS